MQSAFHYECIYIKIHQSTWEKTLARSQISMPNLYLQIRNFWFIEILQIKIQIQNKQQFRLLSSKAQPNNHIVNYLDFLIGKALSVYPETRFDTTHCHRPQTARPCWCPATGGLSQSCHSPEAPGNTFAADTVSIQVLDIFFLIVIWNF